jgi:hypothetical protein
MPSVENYQESSIQDWEIVHRPLSKDLADKAEKKLAELEARIEEEENKFKPQPLRSKLIWVGVDLDGTLAEPLWTPDNPTTEIGDPIWSNVDKLKVLVAMGYKIFIHTSRPWTDYAVIEQWLQHYGIPYKEIQCGKPLYAAYIDDRAINAEEKSWLPQ